MRKHYIDNIRFLCVLLLFIYHTCMIYNSFGENFYIRGPEIKSLSNFVVICSPWFMPLMFVIAGISSSYALKHRKPIIFLKERFNKLFIPLIFGLLLYIPIQTFYAEKFHNNYSGNFFEQYGLFFTKIGDLTGYTGGFTPGHLWFILYLFVISCISLPIILIVKKKIKPIDGKKITILKILPLFLLIGFSSDLIVIGGKSLSEYLILFLIGYFILSEEKIIKKLEKNRNIFLKLSIIFIIFLLIFIKVGNDQGLMFDIYYVFLKWFLILTILGNGKHYLNFSNPVTNYLSKASFPIYFFHQSWLVLVAFYVFKITSNVSIQVPLIIIGSLILTLLNYELFKRIPITRFMFGIKNN